MARYRKGQHDLYAPTDHAARARALANPPPLCRACSGSGVVADDESQKDGRQSRHPHGRVVRCQCGKSPGQHSVRRRLKKQEAEDARMRDVMLGKGW